MPGGAIHPGIYFHTFPGLGANNLWMLGRYFQGADNPNNSLVASFANNTFIINFKDAGVANVVGLNIGCTSKLDFPDCIGPVSVETLGFGGFVIGGFELEVSDEFVSFLGIANNEPISQIRITPVDPNGDIGMFVGVDAVYFGFIRNVPTMSEWGMIATVAGLGIIGFMVIRRRRKTYI